MNGSYHNNKLSLDITDGKESLDIAFSGKSDDRNPGKFITPIITDALKACSESDRILVMNFKGLEFMNSSTITPIVKLLQEARRGSVRVRIDYAQAVKWQELSFTALEIFQTKDKRIEIRGT